MKDLTKGPLFKTLILFAIPIFFGNLFQLFYSLADTRIVGTYLGEEALAAVGGTSVLSNLLIGFMNGMTLGFAVPMARFYGGRKLDKLKEENDWNKPLDKSKCVSYPITDHKVLGDDLHSLSSVECSKILNEYSKTLNLVYMEEYPHRYNRILQVDAEGKILHEIHGDHNNPYKKTDEYTTYSITLWVITDKDGNYDKDNGVMVMYSKANESEKTFIYDASTILEFKSKNGWKDPA